MDKQKEKQKCTCNPHDHVYYGVHKPSCPLKGMPFEPSFPPPAVGELKKDIANILTDWRIFRDTSYPLNEAKISANNIADSILALIEPYIEQRIKEQGYVKLENPQPYFTTEVEGLNQEYDSGWRDCREGIIKAGWRKVDA